MSFLIPFDFKKGDRLDGMTVVNPITRGGNGDLYLVRDDAGLLLALKVIRKKDNDDERNGIEQCRAVAAQISGLVPLKKTGTLADGRFYCVMPLADNLIQWPDYEPDTLANRISKNGGMPPEEVLDIASEILTTLKALHDVGLVHCDIKPENILFIDGKPMLSDYSLLCDMTDHSGESRTGTSGTAGFIPPEMIENPGCYEPKACDLYALGKIIYCAWSGMDEMGFPSVQQGVSLQEMGVMRPLYMRACNSAPAKRFQTADEFISAVEDARTRMNSRFAGLKAGFFGGFTLFRVLILFFVLCTTILANIVLFFFFHPARDANADSSAAATPESIPLSAVRSIAVTVPERLPYSGDPLIVTTGLDVEDPNDDVNSLREAFLYARKHGTGATISFDGDMEIRLSSMLSVSKDVAIDGEKHNITITCPKSEPAFHVNGAELTLRNLTLISDRSGDGAGILDVDQGMATLVSVNDGGKAECLWSIANNSILNMDGFCHLHRAKIHAYRLQTSPHVWVGKDSILEDSSVSGPPELRPGFGRCGELYLSGTCRNIVVGKNGFLEHYACGTIDGMEVEFGGGYSYVDESGAVLTGTITIGGIAWGKSPDRPNIDGKTDIVLDLTNRKRNSMICSYASMVGTGGSKHGALYWYYPALINNIKAFSGAGGFTVRVRENQPAGTYKLAADAADFASPMSLTIGGVTRPDALSLGKSITVDNAVYTLELLKKVDIDVNSQSAYGAKFSIANVLALKITRQQDPSVETTTVVIDGTFDGEGTFAFRGTKITYKHTAWDPPTDVKVNGTPWVNLNEPFELGFEPDPDSGEIVEKEGRNIIGMRYFTDRAELYINDTDDSSSHYRVSVSFETESRSDPAQAL